MKYNSDGGTLFCMKNRLSAYIGLLRPRFALIWSLLFSSAYVLGAVLNGTFSFLGLIEAFFIGFLGLIAGLIINDYVDREFDARCPICREEEGGTFPTKPLARGLIPPSHAVFLSSAFVFLAAVLVFLSFPQPHSVIVLILLFFCLTIEIFYQEEKRNQVFPWAQIIGMTGFGFFIVAGYLIAGKPDRVAALIFLFAYPLSLAYLGVTDLIDINKDIVRGMKTITVLYGVNRSILWIAFWTAVHCIAAFLFMVQLGGVSRAGILAGLIMACLANVMLLKNKSSETAIRILPLFQLSIVIYAISLATAHLI